MGTKGGKANGLKGSNLGPGMMDQQQKDVSSGLFQDQEDDAQGSARIHSGGASKGNFGKPHSFLGSAKSGKSYDLGKAKDKDLDASARLHYLENYEADKH